MRSVWIFRSTVGGKVESIWVKGSVDDDLLSPLSCIALVLAQTSEKSNCRVSLVESPMVSGSWSTSVFLDMLEGEAISRLGNAQWYSLRAVRSRCAEKTGDIFDVIVWRRVRSSSGSSISK